MLLDLEKEIITFATMLGFKFAPEVGVQQLRAIEINPYAYELAQVTVQIGYLQWRRDNGFDNDRSPVLQNLDGFLNEDALLVPHYRSKAKTLKEAQAGEHTATDALKFYTEREWPTCDVLVGNPPFLGGKLLRRELGDAYVKALFETYGKQVRPEADLCCYWFNKARELIAAKRCRRAGLLATQGIRGGANREVLNEIKKTGDIFFAASDRDWILAGANVHVSMIGFDDGAETARTLDGKPVKVINPNLTAVADVTTAQELKANLNVAFMGTTKGGAFDIPEGLALKLLRAPNPHSKPNSDVVIPWVNGMDLTQRPSGTWIIDFGVALPQSEVAKYEAVFQHALTHIKPQRDRSRTTIIEWWLHERRRGEMRVALAPLARFLCTTRVSKYRLFVWLTAPTLPDSATFAFARSDDYFFGIVQGRFHEVWARSQGTQVRERESGFRYTPTTCFETFPFPFSDDLELSAPEPPPRPPGRPVPDLTDAELLAAKYYFVGKESPPPYRTTPATPEEHRAAIAAAAKELNELRECWLNPPEWTQTRTLEFPGTVGGPWSRYVDPKTVDAKTGIGTVRYPRLEPRDADCAAKLKQRTLTNLYNERPTWLDLAHKKLDAAVAAAYGWLATLSDEQILERLLALNLERAAEEAKAAQAEKPKSSRAKRADELV
jgi:type II restriction/modification system DNA methylase subunit YeeA